MHTTLLRHSTWNKSSGDILFPIITVKFAQILAFLQLNQLLFPMIFQLKYIFNLKNSLSSIELLRF